LPRQQRPNHALQTTALVHEAYLRLAQKKSLHVENRVYFLGFCRAAPFAFGCSQVRTPDFLPSSPKLAGAQSQSGATGMANTGQATASRENRRSPVETHPPRVGLSKKRIDIFLSEGL